MRTTRTNDPWGDFWARSAQNAGADGSSGEGRGCLPQGWAGIENAQKSAWYGFVDNLAKGARVLDLATGDARVLRWMQLKRPDLALTGVDLAPRLPEPPPGITVRGDVAMEALPFDVHSFDAVVSQFGFEYGEPDKVAGEIARVLCDGGRVAVMVHRGDGPILEHNLKRRAALLWALRDKAIARKARAALKDGQPGIERAAKLAARTAEQGAKRYGGSSPAWEIPEAIRRSCVMGRQAGTGSIIETIAAIEAHARNEAGRIQSLASACRTADARDRIVAAFAGRGLIEIETRAVSEP
ncbi:MAG: class I SAM-dependent methyltransferase, partial [Erythrobacter sp.]